MEEAKRTAEEDMRKAAEAAAAEKARVEEAKRTAEEDMQGGGSSSS